MVNKFDIIHNVKRGKENPINQKGIMTMNEKEICKAYFNDDESSGIWYSLRSGVQVCGDEWFEYYMITCHYNYDGTENHYLYRNLEEAERVFKLLAYVD